MVNVPVNFCEVPGASMISKRGAIPFDWQSSKKRERARADLGLFVVSARSADTVFVDVVAVGWLALDGCLA